MRNNDSNDTGALVDGLPCWIHLFSNLDYPTNVGGNMVGDYTCKAGGHTQLSSKMNEWMNGMSRQVHRRISLICQPGSTKEYQDNDFFKWAEVVGPSPFSPPTGLYIY